MTPEAFIAKWKAADLNERAAAQPHFTDLCRLLDEPTPSEADPKGEWYAFERGALKTTGARGWADVWKRGHFGWEYKGRGKDLTAAFAQLQQYAIALENPPLLVVCDLDRIIVHTNWTNSVSERHEIALEDLRDPKVRQKLKAVLSDPEQLRPGKTRQALTEQAASEFARLAQSLRERGHAPEAVAHFINRLVFCMFAEDIGLLPNKLFAKMLASARTRPAQFEAMARQLFGAMRSPGGMVGFEPVEWFNGGLFDDDSAFPLTKDEIEVAARAADLDWAEIDPTIFGTLFERGLDPDKRSQLGAHYTDREKIDLIVEPVIIRPWLGEWEVAKKEVAEALERAKDAKSAGARTTARNAAETRYRAFLDRLRAFTVLDPACGSGNFLYVALRALKDLENRFMIEAEALGLQREFPHVGPAAVKGIEINAYAAELARVTVWIGEIQWMRRNGFNVSRDPILKPLNTIECRDALLNADGTEAEWPAADVIIGNPPFLGDKKMVGVLGREYVDILRERYASRVPGNADLVCHWFAKARRLLVDGKADRAGLVAPNSIRRGANRKVLDDLIEVGRIFEAQSDEPWVLDGAAVRISTVCFEMSRDHPAARLDGVAVHEIHADLSAGTMNVTRAVKLRENARISFLGVQKSGPFDVPGHVARRWLELPLNPNGASNVRALSPYWNGDDVTSRPRDVWLIDLPRGLQRSEAALFEAPFEYLATARYSDHPDDVRTLESARSKARDRHARVQWWEPYWPRPEMRRKVGHLRRYIATPETPTHTVFIWLPRAVVPDKNLVVITRDDDASFGILHSRFHLGWVQALGSPYGNHPTARRYNSSRVFETFPFPDGLTPNLPASAYAGDPRATRIAEAARRLDELRRNWLNPADLVRIEPEVVPGFPDRVLPVDDKAAAMLRKRTLTNLYNEPPTWLTNAHADLDRAVAAAYGWPEDISTDDALARLLDLNQARAEVGGAAAGEAAAEAAE